MLTATQAILGIAAIVVAWMLTLLVFAYRIGRFEASTNSKMESLEAGRKENKETVEKLEESFRSEMKETRHDIQQRFDQLFKEIVRK